jgi:hypothetical protein
VIVFNAIKTDTQARASGHDCDSDFVYVTNQEDLAELAKKAYMEYPTIINDIKEVGESCYHFTNEDYANMDNRISDAQEAIGTSTDTAQLALSYYYNDGMKDEQLEECFIILSVIAQISIDLAKKTFDIDVVKEIRRIRNLPCMKRKEIPKFFAENKKKRANKEFDEKTYKIVSMNCPMDIMAKCIDDKVIKRAEPQNHRPIRDFLNYEIKAKGRKDKRDKVILSAKEYNNTIAWIESNKDCMKESTVFALKNRAMDIFIKKSGENLTQDVVKQLVLIAFYGNDTSLCSSILRLLYGNHREKFLKCFVKKEIKDIEFSKEYLGEQKYNAIIDEKNAH